MRLAGVFLGGVLAGAAAISLAMFIHDRSSSRDPAQVAARAPPASPSRASPQPSSRQRDETDANRAEPCEAVATRTCDVARSEALNPQTRPEWEALVGGTLEWAIEHHTGERLPAEKRARLVSELARLREASLALQEAPADPGDPAELRERLAQTLTLVEVDQAFRRELGVGVSEFVYELDFASGLIEDVSRR